MFLYKYMPIATAKIVIETCAFRCSSPITFNDPFDCDINNLFLVTKEMIEKYLNFMPPNNFPQLPESEKKEIYMDAIQYTHNDFEKKNDYKEIQSLLKQSAIFCLSETYSNILMWSHYASLHEGVVIEIDINKSKALNSWIFAAKLVSYSNIAPVDYMGLIYTKASDWSYEKEWRVNYPHTNELMNKLYIDNKFHPSEINSITFGIKTKQADIDNLLRLINNSESDFSHLKFYRMKRSFGFSIERIKYDHLCPASSVR